MPQHTPITCITMRSIRSQDAKPFWKRVSSLRGSAWPPAQGRIAPFIVRNALHCFWRGFASIPNQSSQLWCAGPSILWNFEICWTIDICFSSNWGERGVGRVDGTICRQNSDSRLWLVYFYNNPQNTNYTVEYGKLDSAICPRRRAPLIVLCPTHTPNGNTYFAPSPVILSGSFGGHTWELKDFPGNLKLIGKIYLHGWNGLVQLFWLIGQNTWNQ